MQLFAKIISIVFLMAISYKQLVLCQMANTICACLEESDSDEQDLSTSLLETIWDASGATMEHRVLRFFSHSQNPRYAKRKLQAFFKAPLREVHTPPPNGV